MSTKQSPLLGLRAEQILLGAMLADNQAYRQVADCLRDEHFADPTHSIVFKAIKLAIEAGEVATSRSIRDKLEPLGFLDDLFDTDAGMNPEHHFHALICEASGVTNLREYAQTIRDGWARRRLIDVAQDLGTLGSETAEGACIVGGGPSAAEQADGLSARLQELVRQVEQLRSAPEVSP